MNIGVMEPEYEYKKIMSKNLYVDKLYQRDVEGPKIKKIVDTYNPYLVNAVKVSYRDGKYWIIDGQHTKVSGQVVRGGMDYMVDCKVFYGLSQLDEMNLFLAQNGTSSNVQIGYKLRALYNSGDAETYAMVKAVEAAGFMIDFSKQVANGKIVAYSALVSAYKQLGAKDLTDMLGVIATAWGGAKESLTAEIIGGTAKFYKVYKDKFNRKRLINKLAHKSPIEIVRDGKISNSPGMNKYARVILGIYNHAATTTKLEDML